MNLEDLSWITQRKINSICKKYGYYQPVIVDNTLFAYHGKDRFEERVEHPIVVKLVNEAIDPRTWEEKAEAILYKAAEYQGILSDTASGELLFNQPNAFPQTAHSSSVELYNELKEAAQKADISPQALSWAIHDVAKAKVKSPEDDDYKAKVNMLLSPNVPSAFLHDIQLEHCGQQTLFKFSESLQLRMEVLLAKKKMDALSLDDDVELTAISELDRLLTHANAMLAAHQTNQ